MFRVLREDGGEHSEQFARNLEQGDPEKLLGRGLFYAQYVGTDGIEFLGAYISDQERDLADRLGLDMEQMDGEDGYYEPVPLSDKEAIHRIAGGTDILSVPGVFSSEQEAEGAILFWINVYDEMYTGQELHRSQNHFSLLQPDRFRQELSAIVEEIIAVMGSENETVFARAKFRLYEMTADRSGKVFTSQVYSLAHLLQAGTHVGPANVQSGIDAVCKIQQLRYKDTSSLLSWQEHVIEEGYGPGSPRNQ